MHWAYAIGTDASTEHTRQELMPAPSPHIKFEKVPWKHAEHVRQEMIRILSVHVRNWCITWAYMPGTDAFAERTRQELMLIPWSYASVSYAYAQHKRKNSKFVKVPSKYAEHTHKELMHSLSIRLRNWCMHYKCNAVCWLRQVTLIQFSKRIFRTNCVHSWYGLGMTA